MFTLLEYRPASKSKMPPSEERIAVLPLSLSDELSFSVVISST